MGCKILYIRNAAPIRERDIGGAYGISRKTITCNMV